MSDHWYALHVRQRFEKHVQHHLAGKGFETFWPTYVTERDCSFPLFPAYVFCRFNIQTRLPVLMTPGVKCVVGVGRSPTAIEDSEITAIRLVMDSGVSTLPSPYVAIGEMVRVEEGPLKGLVGIVTRVKGAERLILSVQLLMRSISVDIDRTLVRFERSENMDLTQAYPPVR